LYYFISLQDKCAHYFRCNLVLSE